MRISRLSHCLKTFFLKWPRSTGLAGEGKGAACSLALGQPNLYFSAMTKAQRQRLINAILYFARETKFAGQTKLLKLLYLLDFEHFEHTGRSVTGLDYDAWKLGPVPTTLRAEWKDGFKGDLAALVHLRTEALQAHVRQTIIPNDGAEFDESYFTPRQLGLMKEIASRYREAYSQDMISITHAKDGAWDKVWRDGAGQNDPIPYELALRDDCGDREEILRSAREYQAFADALCAGR